MSGNLKAPNRPSAPTFSQSAIATAIASVLMGLGSAPAVAATARAPVTNQSATQPSSLQTMDDDEQLNAALDALRLKKAVEEGIIDQSVLDDYSEQTLGIHNSDTKNNNSKAPKKSANSNLNQNNTASTVNDISQSQLWQQAQDIQRQGYQVLTPAQIERELAKSQTINQPNNNQNGFDAPIATLNSNAPPLGFDTSLDSASLPAPTNLETLGRDDQETNEIMSRPINVSDAVSSGRADLAASVTESSNPNAALKQQNTSSTTGAATGKNSATSDLSAKINAGKLPDETAGDSNDSLNPEDYLPDYQADDQTQAVSDSIEQAAKSKPRARNKGSLVKRLYNRFFNGGYTALPHVDTTVYLQQAVANGTPKLIKADEDIQPINNIKAALDDTTVQSVSDFTAALPRLRQTALDAARAVGYYDVTLRLRQSSPDTIDVIIEKLGDPVRVEERIVDVRGEGATQPEFIALQQSLPPKEGDVFNHRVYKNSKAALEGLSSTYGYFDQYWLNKSVDIILPDNIADMSLVYDTGERYDFDNVVFYTYDRENRVLTTDPEKLPVELSLLRKLFDFREGDPFYRPSVTKFSNDLSATRYFNTVNVETILPPDERSEASTLAFDNRPSSSDNNDANGIEEDNDEIMMASARVADDENNDRELAEGESIANSGARVDDADIAPINFEVDEATHEKLLAIKQKANRLSSLPSDRVLDEKERSSNSFLGKISDSISNVAKKIFPDDEPLGFDENFVPPTLAGKKTPEDVFADKKVPLYVFVSANKPRDAQVGLGYGTDTGVRATARIDYNLINKKGYQAGAETALSRINKSATVYGSRPLSHPLNDKLEAKLAYEEEVIDQGEGNFDLSTKTLKAALARNIHKDNSWDRSYFVRYRLDELETGVDEAELDKLPVQFTSSKPRQQALLLGYGVSKTTADSATNPMRGYRQYYGLEAGSKSLASDTDLAILHAGLSGIYSFGDDNKHQVLGRLESGYIWADDFNDVPYKLRFFAGGDQSIRGYDYNSLSPIDKGYLTGGQILAVGSAEYNYEFKPGFRGAVFTDVGNAYDKDFDTETKVGVGVGIRWASPIGVVRADVAAGVSEDDIPIRLHFFIGSPL
ncbi:MULTISPECIES: autotransporter assembly complex family protein [Psychrobacter]|uniref:autotransporter assembly complex protein TamA n=1 Tax=Psychrobacter TaxID=497 RepID=UPI00146B3889|nr:MULTISPECIES: BamA/TamA family outer membrane protein [Psychrobacter]